MSILNLTEDEKLLYEKYNQSSDIIVKEEAPVEEPVKVAEPVKAEEPVQLQTEPVKFTQEEINLYNKYNSTPKEELGKPLPEPSFLRQLGYGFRQEPFLITSAFRLGKAGLTAAFDPDRTYEEVRAEQEEKRQRQIAFDYPDMFGREESGAVLTGRLLSAGLDVSSFLVPWAKFAKVGTLASAASVGTYGAADVAIRDEALYGEVNPVNVAIGFGGGFVLGAAMEAGMKYYRSASRGKIKTQTSDGQSVEKEVNIPGPTPNTVKVNADEIPQIEKTAKEAHSLNQRLTALYEDIGGVLNRYYDIDESLDPVGKEDGDIDNDGDKDDADKFLQKKRDAITKSIKKENLGGVVNIPALGQFVKNK